MFSLLRKIDERWHRIGTSIAPRSIAVNDEFESPLASPDSLEALISRLREIRRSLIGHASDLHKRASTVHPAYRKSAINLIHYLALRRKSPLRSRIPCSWRGKSPTCASRL